MTITGIDSTGQSTGGNVPPPRQVTDAAGLETDAQDLDAELLSLETDVTSTAPISPAPAESVPVRPLPDEQRGEREQGRRAWWRLNWRDALAIVTFVAVALYVTAPLWLNLDHEMRDDPQDQAFFEWMLAHGARVITHGQYPFFSNLMNYPDGVNMMANTSVMGVSLPLTPITLAFGPHVSFNVFLTLALACTGISWYFVLSRQFLSSRAAAWIGAMFCAFAPSMMAHAGGHPNIVSQFLVPLIIWRTLALRHGKALRSGLILGGLLVWQAFINLEILFMTAVGVGIFCLVLGISRRRRHPGQVRAFLRGLAVAGLAVIAVLAYPLSVQFFGPQSYQGLSAYVKDFGSDLGAFTAYSSHSVAGNDVTAARLAQNPAEENAFFGWGLVILFFGLVVWMRRKAAVVALGGVALLFAAMSLGPRIFLNGINTGIPGIWAALQYVPVLDSAVPTRWAMAIAPVVGIVLALGVQKAIGLVRSQPAARGPVRVAMITAVAMALVPLAPLQVQTVAMAPIPQFITAGTWKQYVDADHTVVTLPLPGSGNPAPMRWSATTGLDMKLAGAYALLPTESALNPDDHTATFAPPWRPTSGLMESIKQGNPIPEITDTRREMALADLRYWHAGVVVLPPQTRDIEMLRAMTEILGFEPTWNGGVWTWDVRKLVDDPDAILSGPDIS